MTATRENPGTAAEHRLVFWTIVMAAAALLAGGQLGMFWKQLRFMREGARAQR